MNENRIFLIISPSAILFSRTFFRVDALLRHGICSRTPGVCAIFAIFTNQGNNHIWKCGESCRAKINYVFSLADTVMNSINFHVNNVWRVICSSRADRKSDPSDRLLDSLRLHARLKSLLSNLKSILGDTSG